MKTAWQTYVEQWGKTFALVVRETRKRRRLRDKLRAVPGLLRYRKMLAEMDLTDLPEAERAAILEGWLRGTGDGSEPYPLCSKCLTAFDPSFVAPDLLRAVAGECAACLRTEAKEKERVDKVAVTYRSEPTPTVRVRGRRKRATGSPDGARKGRVR